MYRSYSLNDMAEEILKESDTYLSAYEIWDMACKHGLDSKLTSIGKTPLSSLSVALSRNAKSKKPKFKQFGSHPFKYALINK